MLGIGPKDSGVALGCNDQRDVRNGGCRAWAEYGNRGLERGNAGFYKGNIGNEIHIYYAGTMGI